jgi:mannose-1-phosphate guanylyltransferase/phosphomannomutase
MKQRLTITLSEGTLRKIDAIIDRRQIRNRSHAIEYVIEEALKPKISTALVLAGGPNPKQSPEKAMTMLNGKPLILYTLEHLQKFGITKVIIATNSEGKAIEKLLGNGEALHLELVYLYETKPLGTAGAIMAAKAHLPSQPFVVISGDVLTNINLDDMMQFHTIYQGLVTMAIKPRSTEPTYDNVFVQGHTVVDFQKSQADQRVGLVNAGVYIIEPRALELFGSERPLMLEKDVFPRLAQKHTLLAFPFQGAWFDISVDTNYQTALSNWS